MQLGQTAEHMALTRSVTRAMGLSLNEAMQTGRLNPQDFAAIVTRCRACAAQDTCRAWTVAQDRLASKAPEFCPNARVFDSLTER